MLPYSPLHHLLLADTGRTLVMTSANVSDEPIAFRDEDAAERLAEIADLFLVHDRPIETRTDDSVVRVVGDLKNYETIGSFTTGIDHVQRLFAVTPEVVAHDLHPEYLSTKHALDLDGVDLIGVQHHHAHLAACLAEHGETGQAVGAIFDGTGYGGDGTVWAWRMACAWLTAAGESPPRLPVDAVTWDQVSELVRTGIGSPLTTRAEVNYEGQAAAELEALVDTAELRGYPLPLRDDGGGVMVLDARLTVSEVASDLRRGVAVATIAARFHNALADATAEACALVASRLGIETAVLSGGVFQNRRLIERTRSTLLARGLRVLIPEALPPNDGGIAFGQLAVAAARLAEDDDVRA